MVQPRVAAASSKHCVLSFDPAVDEVHKLRVRWFVNEIKSSTWRKPLAANPAVADQNSDPPPNHRARTHHHNPVLRSVRTTPLAGLRPRCTQPHPTPTQPNPTQPNPTQPNPTHPRPATAALLHTTHHTTPPNRTHATQGVACTQVTVHRETAGVGAIDPIGLIQHLAVLV